MSEMFDLLVIGGGSAGVRAARVAASRGLHVALAEERHLGGTCVNVGCVPKKLMVYAAEFAEHCAVARDMGWHVGTNVGINWSAFRERKDAEIERLNGIYARLLDEAGVTVLDGHARLTAPGEVTVNDRLYRADKIILAVGGEPFVPAIEGREHLAVSDDLFFLDRLPRRVLIWGAGYIALEFAGIFRGLGCEVDIVHRGRSVLRGFDRECAHRVQEALADTGVRFTWEDTLAAVAPEGDGYRVHLQGGEERHAERVVCALGRRPRLDDLGLDAVPVTRDDNGYVVVDEAFRTSEPGLYALGDITGGPQLTPVAIREAMHCVDGLTEADAGTGPLDYASIPSAIFTRPAEYAFVGLSEEAAVAEYGEDGVTVYRSGFTPLRFTLGEHRPRSLIKLVVESSSERILGAHMVGEGAAEILQGVAVAVKAGLTKSDLDATVGIHPTSAEEWVTLR